MIGAENGNLVLRLNVEHIEYLTIKVLKVGLDDRHIEDHTSDSGKIGSGINSEGHCRGNVKEIALTRRNKLCAYLNHYRA